MFLMMFVERFVTQQQLQHYDVIIQEIQYSFEKVDATFQKDQNVLIQVVLQSNYMVEFFSCFKIFEARDTIKSLHWPIPFNEYNPQQFKISRNMLQIHQNNNVMFILCNVILSGLFESFEMLIFYQG
eukprot:TRINITY_DN1578_c0_g1_i1.p4 TRINITY_DN1578_c0_g1~~TRINITY_DN1578_c0_g1_i1.p4  ORF type:complete len:127 (-),score=1.25 TRINITY_DN1578_c0_g1_i1:203-583(-)